MKSEDTIQSATDHGCYQYRAEQHLAPNKLTCRSYLTGLHIHSIPLKGLGLPTLFCHIPMALYENEPVFLLGPRPHIAVLHLQF